MASLQTGILREWAPLTELLNKLPSKQTLSIFSKNVKITCVDILPEFIALGTNYGVAFWYDRKKNELQRLRCENSNVPITSIKVLCSVEYMLACGSDLGNISIFQIPKQCPDEIPENLKPKNTKVERYTVSELHKTKITALEWSKNGMKLFSGDTNGTVVLTEIDFYMILNETYEVIQLSYNNPKLVISTLYRSIICEKTDKWNVVQIGQKDRKILGPFGGIIQKNHFKLKQCLIYCTRPGLRIWVSDSDGNVQKTLLFKDLLSKDCTEVPLLNPISKDPSVHEVNFGKILPFGDELLVTYNEYEVYILHPIKMEIVSKITRLRRVLDLACNKDEIFVLESDRSLIRISSKPYLNNTNLILPFPLEISPLYINEHTDDEIIVNAEEAKESTELDSLNKFENVKIDDSIEDIIYKEKKQKRKRKKSSVNYNTIVEEFNITEPTLMNLSMVEENTVQYPDLRSPQTIQSEIEYKEKILANVLQFNEKFNENVDKKAETFPEHNLDIITTNKITRQKTMDEISAIKDKSIPIKSKSNDVPAFVSIPNEWSLTPVKLHSSSSSNNISESSDPSSDWELV